MTSTDAEEMAAALGRRPVPPDATVAYGGHPDQVIDLYAPHDAVPGRPAPLAVLVHGGFWRQEYDRVHASPFAGRLAAAGFAVASVEYRRVGGAGGYPETLDDIAAAVDAVAEAAVKSLGAGVADPDSVVLTGHSAGGHLVLWSAARHRLPQDAPWHRCLPLPVRGVVALAPVADLRATVDLALDDNAAVQFLGDAGRLAQRLPHADPAGLLPTGIATTIVHGTTDSTVPPQVAEGFAATAEAAGQSVRRVWLDGVGHYALIDPDTAACATVVDELRRLVGVPGAVRPRS
ncbi:alpha/beta hydrolase [Streptomyces sp. RB6PN25]|uniref:Alpha/beta hydrolase n=1 Tax=Streptomyces humicola TaxID=2953240 RepID=A0ABT1PVF5_9ACTN|nr:alpha/beta hydrolase [Streptomyces humicola]MCQ4081651.1 alpha/beta hydrolase [Streptomyces humicola]